MSNPFEIKLDGKLITGKDPSVIGKNYQSLKNLRYVDEYLEGVGGMTRVNSSAPTTGGTANPKIRAGFQYNKTQPSENHLLVHAYRANNTNPKIFDKTDAVPSTGNFSTTPVYTLADTTTLRTGMFTEAPQDQVVFCDGKDSLIWGGNEFKVSRFINYYVNNPTTSIGTNGTLDKDFTAQVQDNSSANIATLTQSVDSASSNTKLLLHLNNAVTDSSTAANAVTNNGAVAFSTSAKFGSHCALYNGSSQFFSIPDNARFDFSDEQFTVDCWVNADTSSGTRYIFSQGTSTGSGLRLYLSNLSPIFNIKQVGTDQILIGNTLTKNTWNHLAFQGNGTVYRLFVNGIRDVSSTVNAQVLNYTGSLVIGARNDNTSGLKSTNFWSGRIDEFRISDGFKYPKPYFEPRGAEYGTNATYMYLASIRPIKGFKVYIGTANTTAGEMDVQYWSDLAWSSVTNLVDGTSAAGVSFAQTGSVTFDSTVSTAKPRLIKDTMLYWYRIVVPSMDNTTTVKYMTVDMPMQQIKDIWDGEYRKCYSFQTVKTKFSDYTTNVLEEDYSSTANTAAFAALNSCGANDYILAGFSERMMGLNFLLAGGKTNSSTECLMSVKYWNGRLWINQQQKIDNTISSSNTNATLSRSGTITWNPPDENSEFLKDSFAYQTTSFKKPDFATQVLRPENETEPNKEVDKVETKSSISVPLYYYKISFSTTNVGNVFLDKLEGIPAPQTIKSYKGALNADNRIFLYNQENTEKNEVKICSYNAPDVWNGEDSAILFLGDGTEILRSESLYTVFGSSIYDSKVFYKGDSIFSITGSSPDNYVAREVTTMDGIAAPKTLKKANVTIGGQARNVHIFQGANGMYIFDNHSLTPISDDISNFFDKRETSNTLKLSTSYANRSDAFIDEFNQEYHWLFADNSSTGKLNREFVFTLNEGKWFEIDRNSSNDLQAGMTVRDSNSNKYNYGSKDSGHLVRLENGKHFDSAAINHELWTGDMALDGGKVKSETTLRRLRMIEKSTTGNTSINTVVKHYVNTGTTVSSSFTLSPVKIGKRLNISEASKKSMASKPSGLFHSLRFNKNTTSETVGFTPLYITGDFDKVREDE